MLSVNPEVGSEPDPVLTRETDGGEVAPGIASAPAATLPNADPAGPGVGVVAGASTVGAPSVIASDTPHSGQKRLDEGMSDPQLTQRTVPGAAIDPPGNHAGSGSFRIAVRPYDFGPTLVAVKRVSYGVSNPDIRVILRGRRRSARSIPE